jgi:nucleotide-binding universal stress UspA family protein
MAQRRLWATIAAAGRAGRGSKSSRAVGRFAAEDSPMSWLPKKCVVVPVDFSDESFAALDTALHLVAQPEHIHVVHVLPVLEPIEPEGLWSTMDDESRRRHTEEALRQRLNETRHQGVQIAVLFGDPGHEIADYAQQVKAELIVLPSHGRRGLSRLLIGSTAERVVRLAHCPVLVLRK